MTAADVARWAQAHPLAPAHVDCATAVMLKILDGKCKMPAAEKQVMEWLYDQVKNRFGQHLGAAEHRLIADARGRDDQLTKENIYEQRVLAETLISRPVMKGFKAMLRDEGLFAGLAEPEDDESA
jgi:hypothetical protein